MRELELSRVFTLIEPGPVVLVTTRDETRNNIMTISWTMVLDFTPMLAITTGAWNHWALVGPMRARRLMARGQLRHEEVVSLRGRMSAWSGDAA